MCNSLAADNEPPEKTIDEKTYVGAGRFLTTHWSVVLAAQGQSPMAQEALEKLCRSYWRPIYCFLRGQGCSPEEAEDVTQGFFARFLERRDLDRVRREKGRLRSYLLVSIRHFLAKERHLAIAQKRGEGRKPIPLEELRSKDGGVNREPPDTLSPDRIYERRWALTVLDQVFARLKNEYRALEKESLFDQLKGLLTGESKSSQAAVATELGMTENALKQALHRFRRRYQLSLREEIAHTVAVPGDIEDELRHLVAVLRE